MARHSLRIEVRCTERSQVLLHLGCSRLERELGGIQDRRMKRISLSPQVGGPSHHLAVRQLRLAAWTTQATGPDFRRAIQEEDTADPDPIGVEGIPNHPRPNLTLEHRELDRCGISGKGSDPPVRHVCLPGLGGAVLSRHDLGGGHTDRIEMVERGIGPDPGREVLQDRRLARTGGTRDDEDPARRHVKCRVK